METVVSTIQKTRSPACIVLINVCAILTISYVLTRIGPRPRLRLPTFDLSSRQRQRLNSDQRSASARSAAIACQKRTG
jgi:hypothetical protein